MAQSTLAPQTASVVADDAPSNGRMAADARIKAPEDMAMIRLAAQLARDLAAPSAAIYWTDFLLSALIGYAALAGAILAPGLIVPLLCALVAILGLYRAGSFIHELTHVKHSQLPGFRFGWNALIGVPLLVPSFLYEGVHNLHHARTRYGTHKDPEYLPLALMKPYSVPLFVLVAALGPIALLVRFAVLAPLSAVIPPLRRLVVERYSGLVINPDFRRRAPEGDLRRQWLVQETAASLWSIALLALVATGAVPLRAFLIFLAVLSGTVVLNQIRTLVAHLWENDDAEMNVTAQYLDSVNVPPPGLLPELWAPVGLRYHALHHLLPSVPYHALPEAHRRLAAELPQVSRYHDANYRGLFGLVARLVSSTLRQPAKA